MNPPRTYLFVPGNRPERFAKALAAGADAVIFDLEDAVSPPDKPAARAAIADWFAREQPQRDRVLVRINDETTAWHADDLRLLAQARPREVMVPKTEQSRQLASVLDALDAHASVIALVETARGILQLPEIVSAPRLARLAFGTLDFAVDLGLSGDERGLIHPSMQIALVSRAAGIQSPVASVTPAIDDEALLLAEFEFARAFGFGAKLCIHPKQVAPIHAALAPSATEIDWARRVLAADASGSGAAQLDGRMIDRPVVLKAQSILARTGDAAKGGRVG